MKRHAVLTSTYVNEFDTYGTLQARALQGAHPEPLRRLARGVAVAIGIALCLLPYPASSGSIKPYQNIKQLANYQLTDKQYYCHNEIVYRESRFNINAIGNRSGIKQTHGYYQMKSESIKGSPYDYQFYRYWAYVLHRYGYTQYDEPNYCAALAHLKSRGWQ